MHLQEWLDTENVVIGTKCNRLLLLNTTTRKVRQPHPAIAAATSNQAVCMPGQSCSSLHML